MAETKIPRKPSPTSAVAIREQERRRLVRLLQARLGGSLNLLMMQTNTYHAALPPAAAQARTVIRSLAGMTARALADLHDLLADLNPSDLYDLGLGAALETLALRIERRYGLKIILDLPTGLPDSTTAHTSFPSPAVALAVYRIAQEALHNAGQHAGAGRVGLSLRSEQDRVRLTIADDGDGFQPPDPLRALASEGKWGLVEMSEQAGSVGGQLDISSVLGVGTQVRAHLPLEPEKEAASGGAGARPIESLTPREQEVLAGVTAGLTNKQIAARLSISDRTVQFHLGNVLGKLGVASRTEAAVLAVQLGLVRIESL